MGNSKQIEYWNARAGKNWTRYQDALDHTLAPLTEAMLRAAAPRDGERALDVGCGCGASTLALAEAIGPHGRVAGIDVSEPMLGRARARLQGARGAPIVLMQADAAAATLLDVDLVVSRLGVMFFVDPLAAFVNLRRTGGRLCFVSWRTAAENPWYTIPADAVAPFVAEDTPEPPGAPGPFSLGDRDRIVDLLGKAGWRDITVEPEQVALRWGTSNSIADVIDFFAHIGAASRRLAEAEPAQRARGLGALGEALTPTLHEDGAHLDGAIWIVSAQP
jgi:SAM-dependent methyltransferase